MFLNLHDAKMRLDSTLIRYKNKPVYIYEVTQPRASYILNVAELNDMDNIKKIQLTSPSVDLSPVPLGNVNYEGDVYYSTRMPIRAWKQGLHKDAFICLNYKHGEIAIPLTCKAIIKTIQGEFPSVKKAYTIIEEGMAVGCAFSRHFSLVDDRQILFHSKIIIGWFNKTLNNFTLSNEFFFFKEHLQESIKQ